MGFLTFAKLGADVLLLGHIGIVPRRAFIYVLDIAKHVLPVGVGHVGLDGARDLGRLEDNQNCAENHAAHGEPGGVSQEVDIFSGLLQFPTKKPS